MRPGIARGYRHGKSGGRNLLQSWVTESLHQTRGAGILTATFFKSGHFVFNISCSLHAAAAQHVLKSKIFRQFYLRRRPPPHPTLRVTHYKEVSENKIFGESLEPWAPGSENEFQRWDKLVADLIEPWEKKEELNITHISFDKISLYTNL